VIEGTGTAAGEAYGWAMQNPQKVACIFGRNPALRSLMTKTSLLDNLNVLAKAGVPLLHVCDQTDPWFNENTKAVEKRYKELGGQMTLILNEADRHGQLARTQQTRAVDFIIEKTKGN